MEKRASNKILVIDDEADLVSMTRLYFETRGYEIHSAADGEEGFSKALELNPDLILLDLMMPKLNGYQLCRELRENSQTAQTPILVLSAKAQESSKLWALKIGANDYITKPFEIAELERKIWNILHAQTS